MKKVIKDESLAETDNALEEAAEELFETIEIQEHENIFEDTFKKIFIAGAEWMRKHSPLPEDTVLFHKGVEEGKRLMMEEAVEAKIYGYDDGSFELIASWLDMPNNSIYKDGDKVKIIIVKQ